jgi:hypothetical protein
LTPFAVDRRPGRGRGLRLRLAMIPAPSIEDRCPSG